MKYANGTNVPSDPNSQEMRAAAREFNTYLREQSALFMQEQDARIQKLARQVNPVAAKFLAAIDTATPEAALKVIEAPIALKSKVYFMAEEYQGNGIVQQVLNGIVKVYAPETRKLYTVEISMVELA